MRVRFVRLLQKNINISLSISKQARSRLPHEANNQYGVSTYVQTKESADCILTIYNAVSSLVVSSYHAGVLRCCCSAGAHSQPFCLQEL